MMQGNDKPIRTICNLGCGMGCGILAHVKDGMIAKIEPADFPDPRYRHLCARALATVKLTYHPDRLRHPLKRVGERGDGKWQRISWDEALDIIGDRLTDIAARHGPRSLYWQTGGAGLLDLVYARLAGCLGASAVSLIGFGDAAGPCGDRVSFGTLWGESYQTAFEEPRLCVVWGNNPAETQPFGMRKLLDARDNGAKIVVLDPRYTPTAALADEYIPIRPGTDTALALGLMHVILAEGLYDAPFICRHTVGPLLVSSATNRFLREPDISPGADGTRYVVWDSTAGQPCLHDAPGATPSLTGFFEVGGGECRTAFQLLADMIAEYTPERVSGITGVPAEIVRNLALDYTRLKPAISFRGMGLQRTFHGDITFRAISTLAAITGNMVPEYPRTFVPNMRAFMRAGGRCTFVPVLEMYDAMAGKSSYPVKSLFIAKHNLLNQIPDASRIRTELFPNVEFIVVADLFMNASARYADIVLPACSFYEQNNLLMPPGGSPGVHNYLQLQQRVIDPLPECRTEIEIARGVAERMGYGEYFKETDDEFVEVLLTSDHPSMAGVTLARLKDGPVPLPPFDVPGFMTPSGRMEFYSEKLVDQGEALPVYIEPLESTAGRETADGKYPLVFLNAHTRYRTHSVFANVDTLRVLDPEPVIEMNPVDAGARDIIDGDMVRAFNDRGRAQMRARVHAGIMPGVVNVNQGWWPEDFVEGSHQDLTHSVINPAQQAVYEPNAALYDVAVEVEKVREG